MIGLGQEDALILSERYQHVGGAPKPDPTSVRNVRTCPAMAREKAGKAPLDEIATAIARYAGCLTDGVAIVESIDSGKGTAIY
jgi:hypothetical protein